MTRQSVAVLLVVVAMCALAHPSYAAGGTVEFTPVIGHFAPLNSQFVNTDVPIVASQEASTAYGARLGWWVIPRLAVEGGVVVGSSSLEILANDVVSFDARMVEADVRVRFRLSDPAADTGFDLIGGLGVSDLGDNLSDLADDEGFKTPATFTGIVGLGGTIAVTERVRVRFDAEDHIHGSSFDISDDLYGMPVDTRTQHDLILTAGVVIPVWQQ